MLDVSVLHIRQLSSQLDYELIDPGGQVVGRATQVGGPKPRKGLLSVFGSGVGDARVVVQVGYADGTPAFFVDRQGGSPVAIVAPDGTLIGRYDEDRTATARQMASSGGILSNVARIAAGAMSPAQRNRLLDAAGRPLCVLDWTFRHNHDPDNPRWHPVQSDYTDLNGVQIARLDVREGMHKDQYQLQFLYQLPEPLRTLAIASPLAFDLTRT
ncbi:hypothetical protein [Actinomadura terrae]|uniref:hypothetical protein n=1 Tax=Actinomadura terrae TaxID=604353 RepID=UPI001FA73ED5|nr:hypothetical protein [Actinomadura terrae]